MSKFHDASNDNASRKISSTSSGVIEMGGSTLDMPIKALRLPVPLDRGLAPISQ